MEEKKVALLILDGWGHGKDPNVSALAQANTPFMDSLYKNYSNAELVTFGLEVGLPKGQMGNSEVGHLNIGAGRVVYQDLAKINKNIRENTLVDNKVLQEGITVAENGSKRIHLMGLLSDGGVHSHINHVLALCDILSTHDVEVYIHTFLDGRDTDPMGGADYIQQVISHIAGTNAKVATVVGRYYAMDRDKRWERVKVAYDLLVNGEGEKSSDIVKSVQLRYAQNITDEFMNPICSIESNNSIQNGDTVLFFNYRTDRPRELTEVLTQEAKPDFDMKTLDLHFMTMTRYDASFKDMNVLFEKDNLVNTLGEVLERESKTQLRAAETEKYPHVTFFFSGGREEPYNGEKRIMIPSPKVATYDLRPEMSAYELTKEVKENVKNENPDFICLNYANTDMIGHTGIFDAGVRAAQAVDHCLAILVPQLLEQDYTIIIIADHGNSDIMINPDGSPHTAHTTNMVPVILVTKDTAIREKTISNGKLGDLAPTILGIMGIELPEEMKASRSLLS